MIEVNILVAEWARKGAEKTAGKHGRMCDECAFRKGTEANNEEHNVNNALHCMMGMGRFHCHQHGEDGKFKDAEKPCAGFLYAMEHANSI